MAEMKRMKIPTERKYKVERRFEIWKGYRAGLPKDFTKGPNWISISGQMSKCITVLLKRDQM